MIRIDSEPVEESDARPAHEAARRIGREIRTRLREEISSPLPFAIEALLDRLDRAAHERERRFRRWNPLMGTAD